MLTGLSIVAESGDLHSPSKTLLDAIFYDKGLEGSGNHNENWTNTSSRLTVSYDANGTTLANSSGNDAGYYRCVNNLPSSFAVEFQLVSFSGQWYISYDGSTSRIRLDTRLNGGESVKLEYNDGNTTLYVNDTVVASNLQTNTLQQLGFSVYNNAQVKFKEFKVYPI